MKERLDYLDSCRALAALGVVYLHAALALQPLAGNVEGAVAHFFTMVIDPGKIGVILFFMVSGFVIPISLRHDKPKPLALRNFLLGRLFRLYPIYWLSMVLAFFVFFDGSFAKCPGSQVLLNATMFQGFFGVRNMIGVYWTLQIEWMFYILCAGLFVMGWLTSARHIFVASIGMLAAAVALAAVRYATQKALPVAAPLGLSLMFAATLWRMLVLDGKREIAPLVKWALGSFAVLIPVISLLAYNFDAGHGETWSRYAWCYWIAIGLFLACTTRIKITWAPLTAVGRASYSLYLFSDFAKAFVEWLLPPEQFAVFSIHAYIVFEIVVCCLFALLLYRFVEKPFLALGKKVIAWSEARGKGSAVLDPIAVRPQDRGAGG